MLLRGGACIRGKSGMNGGWSFVGWSVSVPMCWKNRSKPPDSVPISRAASSILYACAKPAGT